jgi:hypothetical protein
VLGIYPPDLSHEGMLLGLRALFFVGYWAPTAFIAYVLDWKFWKAARDPDPKVMEQLS